MKSTIAFLVFLGAVFIATSCDIEETAGFNLTGEQTNSLDQEQETRDPWANMPDSWGGWNPELSDEDRHNLLEIRALRSSFIKWLDPWPGEQAYFDYDAFLLNKAAWEKLGMEEHTLRVKAYDGKNIPSFDCVACRFDKILNLARGLHLRPDNERGGILVIYDPVYHYPKYFEDIIYNRMTLTSIGTRGAYRWNSSSFVTSFTPNYSSDGMKAWKEDHEWWKEYDSNRPYYQLLSILKQFGLLGEGDAELTVEEMLEILYAYFDEIGHPY